MNKELKGKLEKALDDAGLDKGQLTFLNVSKEEEIQGVIDNLLKIKTPQPSTEEILKRPEIQSEIDRRITEAKKSWDSKPINKSNHTDPPQGLTAENIAEIVAKAQEPLLEKLNGFEQSKTREGRLAQAKSALNESSIPEKNRDFYLELYNPDSEQPLTDWVKKQEEKHEAYAQSLLDGKTFTSAPPSIANNVEMTDAEATKIAASVEI